MTRRIHLSPFPEGAGDSGSFCGCHCSMPDLTDTLRADRRHKMLTSFAAGQRDLSAVRFITIEGLRGASARAMNQPAGDA